ncbi:hypothetical protein ONZ45_g10998 [Pleurotus djamor]|nr:hypothetical protein ONZ45_g10998 [Pleurotus djamor]
MVDLNDRTFPAPGSTDDYLCQYRVALLFGDQDLALTMLQRAFGISNLQSRVGLKKVHENFDMVYHRLHEVYTKCSNDILLLEGIMVVFRLISSEKPVAGIVKQILPLLNTVQPLRHSALDALLAVARPRGDNICTEIARLSPVLMQLMSKHPNEHDFIETCILIICDTAPSALAKDDGPDPLLMRILNIKPLLDAIVKHYRRPFKDVGFFGPTLELCITLADFFAGSFLEHPGFISFTIAAMRLRQWDLRSRSLLILLCTAKAGLQDEREEVDLMNASQSVLSIIQGSHPHLRTIMDAYGFENCDLPILDRGCAHCLSFFHQFAEDRDLYKLSIKLRDHVMTYEWIDELMQKVLVEAFLSKGHLPFRSLTEAMQHCATNIRKDRRYAADQRTPDILESQYLLLMDRSEEAAAFAERALQRNPSEAWFHWVIATRARQVDDNVTCLKACLEGLKSSVSTPYLRYQFLTDVVYYALHMGLALMRFVEAVGKRDLAITFFLVALQHSEMFIQEAPPDHRRMSTLLDSYIVCLILIEGPDMDSRLNDVKIKSALSRLETARQFSSMWSGSNTSKTRISYVRELLTEKYAGSTVKWRSVISAISKDAAKYPVPDRDSVISTWLGTVFFMWERFSGAEEMWWLFYGMVLRYNLSNRPLESP